MHHLNRITLNIYTYCACLSFSSLGNVMMITTKTEASNTVVTITTIMTTAAATTTMMRMVISIISDQ